MIPTPTDEIRAIRRELAARCGKQYSSHRRRVASTTTGIGCTYITLPPMLRNARPCRTRCCTELERHDGPPRFVAHRAAPVGELGRSALGIGQPLQTTEIRGCVEFLRWLPSTRSFSD